SNAPIIEDWVLDDEKEKVEKKEVKPWLNFVKATTDNNPRETIKNALTVNAARLINVVHPKRTINAINQESYFSKQAHLFVQRPNQKLRALKNSYANKKVKIVWVKKVNTTKPKVAVNAAKAKAKHKVLDHGNLQQHLQDKGVIDSGCSRHMIGNMSFLIDYEEIDKRNAAFGGNPKGGKITSQGKIKTKKLDFENVYFVRELKFNLFSVSQICDKKKSVIFTDTECIVISPDFKLINENQILLRVSRQNNMYSIDLKNIVPTGGLTCLFAKATEDEYKLWHRRLGHLNFKTINKLVKGNLVRGLPSKIFENDQSCVACQKGNQYRSSCNTKVENSISTPLHLLDMDLFEPTFVKSLNKKMVLVTKPYNKTPYELFHDGTPAISFLRPFGCHVNILNTIDHLGKFDGKADEGFFVGYSLNSSRPNWLFDIDALNKIMNYQPVVAQSNDFSGEEDSTNNTNRVNTVTSNINVVSSSRVNAVGTNISIDLHPDPSMPLLEDISIFEDSHNNEDVFGAEADFYNLDSTFQGHTQKEGIHYDEMFAPVARIEAIRLFMAYASLKYFRVYQMDVKSEILYGKIEEDMYVFQPPGFEDPDFPNKVYKVKKALYDLHQAPRACTPMETLKPLLKDEDGEEVDVHMYISMIGSLMYLTSSKPDIMFVVCTCARYQVTPKVSHLHAMKRIFRYLKGQPKLGLWYPKNSPFDLVAYTDNDYAGESLDRKSTTEGCQFLVCRLISWQCKKQTVVANSTTEVEYVAALKSDGFEQIVDFLNANPINYALTVSPIIYTSCIKQFWTTVKIKTVNDDVRLKALIDGKKVVVNEASIRHDLKLNDLEGIFVNPSLTKKVFANMKRVGTWFSRAVTHLFGTMMVQALEERKHKPRRKQRMETEVSPIKTNTEEHVPTPFNDPLPSGEDRMQLKELMELSTNLSNKVLDLENEVIEIKSSYKAKIKELESRVEKLEEENRSSTNELKSFNPMVESLTIRETVMDKEESSQQGRKIADIDADAEVNMENVYNLDMAHEEIVLSMQDVDVQSERIEDVVKDVFANTENVEGDVVATAENLKGINAASFVRYWITHSLDFKMDKDSRKSLKGYYFWD
nr:ribonuclease H-like domain-containing protein [Tanacetum cinerariifolium]